MFVCPKRKQGNFFSIMKIMGGAKLDSHELGFAANFSFLLMKVGSRIIDR